MNFIKKHPRMIKAAAIATGLIGLYALIGFWLAPYLLRTQAPAKLASALGAPVHVDDVSFNPFSLRLEVRGFSIGKDPQKPTASFGSLVLNLQASSLFRWAWVLSEITISQPYLKLVLDKKGFLNLPGVRPDQASGKKQSPASLPPFLVQSLNINKGRLLFEDQTGATEAQVDLRPIDLQLKRLSTLEEDCDLPQDCGPFSLSATTAKGERIDWKGKLDAAPLASNGSLRIDGLRLASLWEFLRGKLALARTGGKIDLETNYSLAVTDGGLKLGFSGVGLKAANIRLRPADAQEGDEEFRINSLTLAGGELDLISRKGRAESLMLGGVSGELVLDSSGHSAWARVLPAAEKKPQEEPAQVNRQEDSRQPWRFGLGKVEIKGKGLAFVDHTPPGEPFRAELAEVDLSFHDLGWPLSKPWPFDLNGSLATGGRLSLRGKLISLAPELQADYEIKDLALMPAGPYLAQFSQAHLANGALSSKGGLTWGDGGLQLEGSAMLAGLSLQIPAKGKEIIGLKRLSTPSLKLNQQILRIDEADLVGPRLKLVIGPKGRTNLAQAFSPPERDKSLPGASPSVKAASGGKQLDHFSVRLGLVKIRQGQLDFSDQSLKPAFHSLAKELAGAATGVSNLPGRKMNLELEGRVDRYGAARIKGSLRPLAFGADTELRVAFDNLDLKHLSPYSATFAGYRLAGGKLNLDLSYRLQDGRLVGDNKVMAQDLLLGDKVESPDAPDLPLELAIALLEDSSGRIEVAVPVSGNLNDPQVDVGGLVTKAIINLITKVVTVPFRLLASLVGSGGDDLDRVDFPPGRAKLPPPQEERLNMLARALLKRPQLRLGVTGGYSLRADEIPLKELALRRELAAALGRELPKDAERVELSFASPELVQVLQKMYSDRMGEQALAKRIAEMRDRINKMPEQLSAEEREARRNRLEQDLSHGLYTELVQARKLPQGALDGLAKRRTQAVTTYLIKGQGLEQNRIDRKGPAAVQPAEDGSIPTTLSLGVE